MADMLELIARLEAAEVGGLDLDMAVRDAVGPPGWLPSFTTSLDAALALAERVLPGFYGQVYFDGADCCAYVGQSGPASELREKQGSAETPALALCIAILKAKAHGTTPPDGEGR